MPASSQRILILGATSAIAHATARLWAARGARLFLVARNPARLGSVVDDLSTRYGSDTIVGSVLADFEDARSAQAAIDCAVRAFGAPIDIALVAHGALPDQQQCMDDVSCTMAAISANGLSTIVLCTRLASILESQRHGSLVVITSVAADRGRRSNYVYGAAKSLVATFLQGLRHRLVLHGVSVTDVRPGFVNSPMTAHLKRGGLLWVDPPVIAAGIVRAVDRRKPLVYLPTRWFWIMMVIRSIPDFLFRHVDL